MKLFDDSMFDLKLSEVSAWSTLVFFNDPVLSSMLYLPDYSLIELIIHELTHCEVFIASNTTFNENIANLMGIYGAKQFMRYNNNFLQNELLEYEEYLQDKKVFRLSANKAYKELNELYASLEKQPFDSILKARSIFFASFKSNIYNLPLSEGSRYYKLASKEWVLDNCFFVSYAMYNQDFEEIEARLVNDFDGNLKDFMSAVKKENSLFNWFKN